MMNENNNFLTEQIITYIGNKRKLLTQINDEIIKLKYTLQKDKVDIGDLFSGSGIVSRLFKQHANNLYVNDLEDYSYIINACYLTNKAEFNENKYLEYYNAINKDLELNLIKGIISNNYSPDNDDDIKIDERVFYTKKNGMIIDTIRNSIEKNIIDEEYKKYFIAPLLYEASVHVNTSGVFKGFYKSKINKIGKFGGDGENALERIKGDIILKKPVFSNFDCNVHLYKNDVNKLISELPYMDIVYYDPPYNQHPYGSNYFMLNVILHNRIDCDVSKVSGIPLNWNKSAYNKKSKCFNEFNDLINNTKARYIIISYNNEGFIKLNEMTSLLKKYGNLSIKEIDYNAFRGSRNLNKRNKYVTEYLFTLEKK